MDSVAFRVILGKPQSHEGVTGAGSQNRCTGQGQNTLGSGLMLLCFWPCCKCAKASSMTCLLQRMRTPLHLAALQGDAASVMGLCTYKAKVNLKDEHALTPLHKAAAQGHNEAAEELLAHNANPDATDEVMSMLPACHAGLCCPQTQYSSSTGQKTLRAPTAYFATMLTTSTLKQMTMV